MHNEITLIIPTFNRSEHLSRLLTYYSRINSGVNFLVLDSSSVDERKKNINCIGKSDLKISHIQYSDIKPLNKICQGIQLVKTRYAAFCADDDIVFLHAINEMVLYLEKNKDVVCVDGVFVNFKINNNIINLGLEYSRSSIKFENRYERVFSLMQKYESLFYGVYRTSDAKIILNSALENDNYHFQELHQSVAALLVGKHHRLPHIYGARQQCEPAEFDRDRWQTTCWFSSNSIEFIKKYAEYVESLYEFYVASIKPPHIGRNMFTHFMNLSHAIFFSKSCTEAFFFRTLVELWPNSQFQIPQNMAFLPNMSLLSKCKILIAILINRAIILLSKILNKFFRVQDYDLSVIHEHFRIYYYDKNIVIR